MRCVPSCGVTAEMGDLSMTHHHDVNCPARRRATPEALPDYDARIAVCKYACSLLDRTSMGWDRALAEALALWFAVPTEEAYGNMSQTAFGITEVIRDNPERLFKR